MASSRTIIAEFVGVFLIGALAGGLVAWSYSTNEQLSSFMSRTNIRTSSLRASTRSTPTTSTSRRRKSTRSSR
ncbi:MAG: hypothetical protein WDO13_13010 [Verrucomicrobiota bacterium]